MCVQKDASQFISFIDLLIQFPSLFFADIIWLVQIDMEHCKILHSGQHLEYR